MVTPDTARVAARGRAATGADRVDPASTTAADDQSARTDWPASLGPLAILSQAPTENFPVASRMLPAASRRHLMAIYGFARLTDDIGDEAPGDRVALLDWLERDLRRSVTGSAVHPLLQALTPAFAELDLPLAPFVALIDANRQDQTVHRYESFEDLVAYCMLSAAPVGRLVLLALGHDSPGRVRLSDDVCVALQVVEHLQDVAEDFAADRIYLPLEDLHSLGCDEADLSRPAASPALRRVIALECGRARLLLGSGVPLAASLPFRPRLAVAGFTAGGLAALGAIERDRFDVLGRTSRPRRLGFAARLAATMVGASSAHLRSARRASGLHPRVADPVA
jgi:squalene synthase HpnC